MITKHVRTLIIGFILFGLTSSCEDKDRQTFGKVNLTFDYQETVEATDTSSEDTTENRTAHSEPSQDEFEREQGFIKDRERSETSLEIDVILDENEDLIERSSELKQDYCCARIVINNGTPVTLDLTSLTNYSKTIAIGQAQVAVDLLNLDNLVVYNSVKNVQVVEDVTTSVTFLANDWAVQNQEIEITSSFFTSYSIGNDVPLFWNNTHSARGVKIELFQNTSANIIRLLESNFIGNSYNFDTSNESPINNLGMKVTSVLNDTSYSQCCFDIVDNNEAPTVENISETIDEDQSVEVQLDGDDNDGDNITFSIVSSPSNGSLGSISSDKVTYSPNQDFNGTDTFTYKANDGIQDSDTATVTITITAVNDAPTTNDVSTTIDENRTARVADLTLDGNDVDEDNLTYSLSSNPSNGTASINGNILTYNANQDWNGVETFTYLVNDGELDSNISTITITVNPVNDDPVVTVGEVNTQSLYLEGIDSFTVFNDSELQNITDFAISLWVNFDDDGRWDGLLSKGYLENVIGLTIRRANDNNKIRISQSDAANNYVNILDSNSPILANSGWNHIVVQREDSIWEIYINGNNEGSVDFGSSEPQSFNSTADFVFAKGNGTTEYLKGYLDDIALYKTTLTDSEISSFSENGTWKSAALINSSNLMFYYQLNGDVLDSTSNNRNASNNGADFSNEVPGTNSPISIETDEDLYVDINLSEYVTDVDGDDLTFEVVSSPQHGTTTFVSSNVIRYQPNSDYNGQDSFTWRASDGSAQTNEATVNITINPQDEIAFSSPALNDIISFGQQVSIDWNVHPFNEYIVALQKVDYQGNEINDPIEIGTISMTEGTDFTWTENLFNGGSSLSFWKIKVKDNNSDNYFLSDRFKILPQWETQINSSNGNVHQMDNNDYREVSFHWEDGTAFYRLFYEVLKVDDGSLIFSSDTNQSEIIEGLPTNSQNSAVTICSDSNTCDGFNGSKILLPFSNKLFSSDSQYVLNTYLNTFNDYAFYLIDSDTLNITNSTASNVKFENKPTNRDFAFYDRIPVSFSSSSAINNTRLLTEARFPDNNFIGSFNNAGGDYSSSSDIKTVNLDLDYDTYSSYFNNNESKKALALLTLIDLDKYTTYVSDCQSVFPCLSRWGDWLDLEENFGVEHYVHISDSLYINLYEPYIEINSPAEGSVVNIGDEFAVNYQTYGMRDATIDFVIERGSNEVYRKNNLANSGVYEFETLFLENLSEQGGNPFLGESKEHEIWIYASNSTESSNSNASYEHRIQDYKFTIDATQVNDPVVTFPNGGETLVVGNTYNVEWNFEGIADSLTLSLQRIGPGDIQYSARVKNDGNHPLTIPNVATDFPYKVILESEFGVYRDFSDNEFNINEPDDIQEKTYTLDATNGIQVNSFHEYVIDVTDSGAFMDANLTLSVNGDYNEHLRYLQFLLISPQNSRILLAGGNYMNSSECNATGGCINSDSGTFTNTNFDDSASTNIYQGSPPFIGSFKPNEPFSTFDGEQIFGEWKLIIMNTMSNYYNVDPPDIELNLTYDITSNGTVYEEKNNFIFSPSDQSVLTINENSTGIISIPVSLPANKGIKDLDIELSLDGEYNEQLRYLTINVDIGNSNDAQLIFRGSYVSGSGDEFAKNQGYMYKARFDDEADSGYNNTLMLSQRVLPNSNLSVFDNQTLNEVRIYIYNSMANYYSVDVDRSKVKVFIDPTD